MSSTIADPQMLPLVALARARAAADPTRPIYTFLGDDGPEQLTAGDLDEQATALAAQLRERIAVGDRVLLLNPPGLGYVRAFMACLYAGAIAVPVYPPRDSKPDSRLQQIVADTNARLALTDDAGEPVVIAEGLASDAAAVLPPATRTTDVAYLQYTSGSTSAPRGVMVSHANVLANTAAIASTFSVDENSTVVSWLPLFHDMGLLAGVLVPLVTGCHSVTMSPLSFVQRPFRWLRAISEHRADISTAPNFAYELCARKIRDDQVAQLDLSCWKHALSGAEPVRACTLDEFARRFAPCGFRRSAFRPAFGLAEATLLVSGRHPDSGPEVATVSRTRLTQREVVDACHQDDRTDVVSCGAPADGVTVEIVDPELRTLCAPDRVGEIWVQGAGVCGGYWGRPDESRRLFRAHLADTDEREFLRTGDLGFVRDGELYVAGRLKDVIILDGRNHYPHDIELTVENSHPAIRAGAAVAFSVDLEDDERLVVAAELERAAIQSANGQLAGMVDGAERAIRSALADRHGVYAQDVILLRRGRIPRTTSNKVQRHACRVAYLAGSLQRDER